jgi:hypothetical protein
MIRIAVGECDYECLDENNALVRIRFTVRVDTGFGDFNHRAFQKWDACDAFVQGLRKAATLCGQSSKVESLAEDHLFD